MAVIIEEIEKKPADCSVCDLCIRDEEGKHYCAVNADWVYPYGESVNLDCPVKNYEKPEWIPVSERLPKQGQEVICQCRANIIRVLKLDANGNWYQDAEHCYLGGFVIAWMPLPETVELGK